MMILTSLTLKTISRALIVLIFLNIPSFSVAQTNLPKQSKLRTWTNASTGESGQARMFGFNRHQIYLEKPDKLLLVVDFEELSDADKEFVIAQGFKPVEKSDPRNSWRVPVYETVEESPAPFVAIRRLTNQRSEMSAGIRFPLNSNADQIVIPGPRQQNQQNADERIFLSSGPGNDGPDLELTRTHSLQQVHGERVHSVIRAPKDDKAFPEIFPPKNIAVGQRLIAYFAVPRTGANERIEIQRTNMTVTRIFNSTEGTINRFLVGKPVPTKRAVGWLVDERSGQAVGVIPPCPDDRESSERTQNIASYPLNAFFEHRAPNILSVHGYWEESEGQFNFNLFVTTDRKFDAEPKFNFNPDGIRLATQSDVININETGNAFATGVSFKLSNISLEQMKQEIPVLLSNSKITATKITFSIDSDQILKNVRRSAKPGQSSKLAFSGRLQFKTETGTVSTPYLSWSIPNRNSMIQSLLGGIGAFDDLADSFAKSYKVTSQFTAVKTFAVSPAPKYGDPIEIDQDFLTERNKSCFLLHSDEGFWPTKEPNLAFSKDESTIWFIDHSSILRKLTLPDLKFTRKVFLHHFGFEERNRFAPYQLSVCSEGLIAHCTNGFWIIDGETLNAKRWIGIENLAGLTSSPNSKYIFGIANHSILMIDAQSGKPIHSLPTRLALDSQRLATVSDNKRAVNHIRISADGKYLFAQWNCILRFRIEDENLVFEERSPYFTFPGRLDFVWNQSNEQLVHVNRSINNQSTRRTGASTPGQSSLAGQNAIALYALDNLSRPVDKIPLDTGRGLSRQVNAQFKYIEDTLPFDLKDFLPLKSIQNIHYLPRSKLVVAIGMCNQLNKTPENLRPRTYSAARLTLAYVDLAHKAQLSNSRLDAALSKNGDNKFNGQWNVGKTAQSDCIIHEINFPEIGKLNMDFYSNRDIPDSVINRNQRAYRLRNIGWSRNADFYYVGTTDGNLLRIRAADNRLIDCLKLNSPIDSLAVCPDAVACYSQSSGNLFLINPETFQLFKTMSIAGGSYIIGSTQKNLLAIVNKNQTLSTLNLQRNKVGDSISTNEMKVLSDGSTVTQFVGSRTSQVLWSNDRYLEVRPGSAQQPSKIRVVPHDQPLQLSECGIMQFLLPDKKTQNIDRLGVYMFRNQAFPVSDAVPIGLLPLPRSIVAANGESIEFLVPAEFKPIDPIRLIKSEKTKKPVVLYSFPDVPSNKFIIIYPELNKAFSVAFTNN